MLTAFEAFKDIYNTAHNQSQSLEEVLCVFEHSDKFVIVERLSPRTEGIEEYGVVVFRKADWQVLDEEFFDTLPEALAHVKANY